MTAEQVWAALDEIPDPEIPVVSLVDLGVIRSVDVSGSRVHVQFTPTFQFFGEDSAKLKTLAPRQREVARAPGYFRPDDFLAMFRFVREKAYETKSFRNFLKARAS